MRVLLIGEYSGLHTNLKNGLQSLGIECKLASNGDGWKKIDGSDFELYKPNNSNIITRFNSFIVEPLVRRKLLEGFDVVQMVGPIIFHPYINKMLFDYLRKHNCKVFVSASGGSFALYNYYKEGKLGYYTYDDNPELCARYETRNFKSRLRESQERYIYKHSNGIIPIMYEYAAPIREYNNCCKTIPIGFDSSKIQYVPNIVHDKIIIMHGVLREKDKGTDFILKAMEIIKKKYPEKVELIIDGKKPLNEYLQLLKKTNILIDQCKEHCYGMNALYAMSEGRIVLGGASEKSLEEFGLSQCPVIHIEPNVDQIVAKLESLIQRKDEFQQLGEDSRRFVEEFHNCKRIAEQYIDVWNQ